LAVANAKKLTYRVAARKLTATNVKTAVKTAEIAQKATVEGSPITSARPIGVHANALETAADIAHSSQLEAKLDLVLARIDAQISQIYAQIITVKDEQQKYADSINQKVVIIESQLGKIETTTALQVVSNKRDIAQLLVDVDSINKNVSNVALQQEQIDTLK